MSLLLGGCGDSAKNRVVVYCAHDREFADGIFQEFGRQSGLEIVVRYDTEANKSVGFYEELVREASRPRCDVHWNNEIVATIRLQSQGVYQPYESPSAADYPARCKPADHTWTAFAARARVFLINTNKVKESDRPKGMKDLLDPRWRGQVVMAKPLAGTTLTHAACLFAAWGEDPAKKFFEKLRDNDVRLVTGNKQAAVAVGQGEFAIGLTDTDDAMAEIDAGKSVVILFPDRDAPEKSGMGTLFIPNTVAMVKKCPNPEGARKLIDYLLSPAVEAKLAESESRQIPLNPKVKADIPAAMKDVVGAREMTVDFNVAARNWEAYQKILVKIFNEPQ